MLTQSPSGVPSAQSRMWSIAAEAAEAAEEEPRALMTAAPRCCTVGMNSSRYHFVSTSDFAGLPPTVQCAMSGCCVALWLPQTIMRRMSVTCVPVFAASWPSARLWSSRIIAVKLRRSMPGAFDAAISALVFAGLPTTSTRTSRLAARVERLALRREDLRVREQQVLALHAGAARARADEQRVVAVLERRLRVVGRGDAVERRERAVHELHDDAGERRQRGRDLEQVQVDRPVGAEHLAGGDAEGERIADLAGGAGDGDGGWLLQATLPAAAKGGRSVAAPNEGVHLERCTSPLKVHVPSEQSRRANANAAVPQAANNSIIGP